MPLVAYDTLEHRLVPLPHDAAETFRDSTHAGRYRCPEPNCRAIFATTRDTTHLGQDCFVHPTGTSHHGAISQESELHLLTKILLADHISALLPQNWSLSLDSEMLPDHSRRPDIALFDPSHTLRVAYEIQLSSLSLTEYSSRHLDYLDHGVADFWIFSSPNHLRPYNSTFIPNETERHIIQNSPLLFSSLDFAPLQLNLGVATGRAIAAMSGLDPSKFDSFDVDWDPLTTCTLDDQGHLSTPSLVSLLDLLQDLHQGLPKSYARFASLAGLPPRPSQLQMVQAVAASLLEPHHLLVEAPTGTGKSFGYLIPTALSGRRILISTATKQLQHQLTRPGGDIEQVASTLGTHLDSSMLQGRNNYLCLARLSELDLASDLWSWSETHPTDPIQLAPPHPYSTSQLTITSEECQRTECPYFELCPYERAKHQANLAQVAVVNHDLLSHLARNNHPLFATRDTIVIDEAHDLIEAARRSLTERLTATSLRRLASRFPPHLSPTLNQLASSLEAVASSPSPRPSSFTPLLNLILAQLEILLDAAESRLKASVKSKIKLVTHLLNPPNDHYLWIDEDHHLCLSPLSPATELATNLFSKLPTILTSATLTTNSNFDYIERDTGISSPTLHRLMLDSPFELTRLVKIYIPSSLGEPDEDPDSVRDTLITELIQVSHGAALVLTTSYDRTNHLADILDAIFPGKVLTQRSGHSPASLISQLASTDDAILVGTTTLWQGVDIPGPSLRLVILDKIPYARPDLPYIKALEQKIGSNQVFDQFQLPRAAILLAQGAGRLIRRSTDQGVIALLDPRAWDRESLLNALPISANDDLSTALAYLSALSNQLDSTN